MNREQLDDLRTALRHKRRDWEAVWVCLDCFSTGLAITDMFTEVPMMETVDGRPVGSCKECNKRVDKNK